MEERQRADRVREEVIHAMGILAKEGINKPMHFFRDICMLVAEDNKMESWGDSNGALYTVKNLTDGGAAKHWSLDVMAEAVKAIQDLVRTTPVPRD